MFEAYLFWSALVAAGVIIGYHRGYGHGLEDGLDLGSEDPFALSEKDAF